MSDWLDDAARGLADGRYSRRRVLKSGAAAALASFGISLGSPRRALAATRSQCGPYTLRPGWQCCDNERPFDPTVEKCCGRGNVCLHAMDCCGEACCAPAGRQGTPPEHCCHGRLCCYEDERCCGLPGSPDDPPTCCSSGEVCCKSRSADGGVQTACCGQDVECCDGRCCELHETCCDKRCIDPRLETCCPSGSTCPPDKTCCGKSSCCSASEDCCSDGRCAPKGTCETCDPPCSALDECCHGRCVPQGQCEHPAVKLCGHEKRPCPAGTICCPSGICAPGDECDDLCGGCVDDAQGMCCFGDCVNSSVPAAGSYTSTSCCSPNGKVYYGDVSCTAAGGTTRASCCKGGQRGCICKSGECCIVGPSVCDNVSGRCVPQ